MLPTSGATSTVTAVAPPSPASAPAPAPAPYASHGRGAGGLGLAWAACIVGLLFAAVSAYWGLGGERLLDTIAFGDQARAGDTTVFVAVWAAAVVKVLAAALPLLALRPLERPAWNRIVWMAAWTAAAIMTVYGLAMTIPGLLVQADVLHRSADANDRALAWGAYVWDPWFVIWGLLVTAALLRGRHRRTPTAGTARG